MKARKIILMFVAVPLLLLICSCSKGEKNMEIAVSPTDQNIIDLTTTVYDDTQLSEIAEFDGTLSELNARYPIECLRVNQGEYWAEYLGNQKVVGLVFDSSGDNLNYWVYPHDMHMMKADFDVLSKGQSLEEVRKLDPDGEYLFLYTGRNDFPKVSSHYTEDGYLITIEYDDSLTITNIHRGLI